MKIIFDEGVPRPLARLLSDHEVTTVPDAGWASAKNGRLLALIQEAGYEAFVTCDKAMEKQQSIDKRTFAILLLSTNHFPSLKPHIAAIASALQTAEAGTVSKVECGRFVARKFRSIEGTAE